MYDQLYRFDVTEVERRYTCFALFCGGLLGSHPCQVFLLADVIGAFPLFGVPHMFEDVPAVYPVELRFASRTTCDDLAEPHFLTSGELAKFLSSVTYPSAYSCSSIQECVLDCMRSNAVGVEKNFGCIGAMPPPPVRSKKPAAGDSTDIADRVEQAFLRAMGETEGHPNHKPPSVDCSSSTEDSCSEGERMLRKLMEATERISKGKSAHKREGSESPSSDSNSHCGEGGRGVPPPTDDESALPPLPPPASPPPPPADPPAVASGSETDREPHQQRTNFLLLQTVLATGGRWLYTSVHMHYIFLIQLSYLSYAR